MNSMMHRPLFSNFLVLFLFISLWSEFSQAQIGLVWWRRDDTGGVPRMTEAPSSFNSDNQETYGIFADTSNVLYQIGVDNRVLYLYRYNKQGDLIWKASLRAYNVDSVEVPVAPARNVGVGNGAVYIAGHFQSTDTSKPIVRIMVGSSNGAVTQLNRSAFLANATSCPNCGFRGFVMRFNELGVYTTFTPLGSRQARQSFTLVNDLVLDKDNNVYICGESTDTLIVPRNSGVAASEVQQFVNGTCNSTTDTVGSKAFIIKYDQGLTRQWSSVYGFAVNPVQLPVTARYRTLVRGTFQSLTSDGDNVYALGNFNGRINYIVHSLVSGTGATAFNGSVCDTNYTTRLDSVSHQGGDDLFLVKYQQGGAFQWLRRQMNSNNHDLALSVKFKNSNLYVMYALDTLVTQFPTHQVSFVGGNSRFIYMRSAIAFGVVENLYFPVGEIQALRFDWHQYMHSSTYDITKQLNASTGVCLDINRDGEVYVTGLMQTNVTVFNTAATNSAPYPSGTFQINPAGGKDAFFIKYNPSGNYVMHRKINGNSVAEILRFPISVDDQDVYVGGGFLSLIDFEPSPGVSVNYAARSASDAFIAKYGCFDIFLDTLPGTATCEGTPINLRVTSSCPTGICDFSYQWQNLVSGTSLTTGVREFTFNPQLGSNIIRVIATDNNTGCVSRDSIEIIVGPQVTIGASPSSVLLCPGTPVTFTATTNSPTAILNWRRGSSNGAILGTGNSYVASSAGAYVVEAVVGNCKTATSVVYNEYNQLSPRIIPDTPSICGSGGSRVQVVDCPGCNYVWQPPAGSAANSTNNFIVADIVGNYAVNISDGNGCLYGLSANVQSRPYLTPTILAKDALDSSRLVVCNGRPLILEVVPSCASCTYQWSDGSTGAYNFAFNASTHQVTVTDNINGCVGVTSPVTIRESTLATPAIVGQPTRTCADSMAVLRVGNPCVGCSYQWFVSGHNNFVNTGTVFDTALVEDFYVRVRDSLGCTENSGVFYVDTVLAVSNPTITPFSTPTSPILLCGANTALLTTQSCVGCNYQWNLNGVPISGATNNQYSATLRGTYTVDVIYANTCRRRSNTASVDTFTFNPVIKIPDSVSASLTPIGYICNTRNVRLSVTGSFALPPLWSYQWFRNGIAISGATGYELVTNQPGIYNVRVTQQGGCAGFSNTINLIQSTNGTNPVLSSDRTVLCQGDSATLSIFPAPGCEYLWRYASGFPITGVSTTQTVYRTDSISGYYVIMRDTTSKCEYNSNLIQIRDTVLPSPVLSSSTLVPCNPNPVILSTTPCSGCRYGWERNTGATTVAYDRTQNTITTDTSGNYRVRIYQPNGCATAYSNYVALTFSNVNAQIVSPPISSVCNGQPVSLRVLPDTNNCNNCTYLWFQNNIQTASASIDTFAATQSGSYFAVVINASNCRDTTNLINVNAVNVLANIDSSARGICGPGTNVVLRVDSCTSCVYDWFFGGTSIPPSYIPLTGSNNTILTATGPAAEGIYKVSVSRGGCAAVDSIYVGIVPAFFDTIVANPSHFNSCNGLPVTLTSQYGYAGCTYQWYKDGSPISGAITQSYSTNSTGSYYVMTRDSNGCMATSPSRVVNRFDPVAGFALNFDPLGASIPITSGNVVLNNYLQPTSLHSTGNYSSLTATIDTTAKTFDPAASGPGIHLITYTYRQGACSFSVTDTIRILQPVSMDVLNQTTPSAPQYEACANDTIVLVITNFTFKPTSVRFVGNPSPIVVNLDTTVFTSFAGVFSGNVRVRVPRGALTGKLILSNGTNNYQSPFFMVVNSPASSLSLSGVSSPLCSNQGVIELVGVPSSNTGYYTAAYQSDTTLYLPQLLSGDSLLMDSIGGYDAAGVQQIQLRYVYIPTYSNNAVCPRDSVVSILNVQVRDVRLDSIVYTPLSITQPTEQMRNLTLAVFPVTSRLYNGSYSGTYVASNNLLPSTISTGPGNQTVTYTVNNGGCANSITDTIAILPRPSILDSLPVDICQSPDTIYIGRNTNGVYIERRINGVWTTTQADAIYAYRGPTIYSDPLNALYNLTEQVNLFSISSSGGGLITINSSVGAERYGLIPSQVVGSTTTLNIQFSYTRNDQYYVPTTTNANVNYTIARAQRTITFEQPINAQINPAIVADTIFCRVNQNIQLTGIPAGGVYSMRPYAVGPYLPLAGNVLNPSTQTPGHYQLQYFYQGRACVDSTRIGIRIPQPFTITNVFGTNRPTAPNYCEREAPDSIQIAVSPAGIPINYSTGIFNVGGLPAGQFFNPATAGNATTTTSTDTVVVTYTVSDSFGCSQSFTRQFFVHPTPIISMQMDSLIRPTTNHNLRYCLNAPAVPITLSSSSVNPTGGLFTLRSLRTPTGGIVNGTATPTGTAPSTAFFSPRNAGVGSDTVLYAYVDGYGCTDTIRQRVQVLALPVLAMSTTSGAPLNAFYCEGDSIPLFGSPFNATSTFASFFTNNPSGTNLRTSGGNNRFVPFIASPNRDSAYEVILYTYRDLSTNCRDTIYHRIQVRNLADPIFAGLPAVTCANPTALPLTISTPAGGATVDSATFTASPSFAAASIRRITNLSASFRPDSTNVLYNPTNIVISYRHRSHGTCWGINSTNILVNPLPQLRLTNPGDQITSISDSRLHICETQDSFYMRAFRMISANDSTLIFPDSAASYRGRYLSGRGIVFNPTSTRYNYLAAQAINLSNNVVDTILYEFTDQNNCTNTTRHIIVVDTIPDLSFAGFEPTKYDTLTGRYVHCQNDAPILVIPSPFGGFLRFGQQLIPTGLLNLRFDSLAMPGNGAYRFDTLYYEYVSARYATRPACLGDTLQVLETRPIPILQFNGLPTQFCIGDTNLIPLRATPAGGNFIDISTPQVAGGIVADTFLNAAAQFGRRTVAYSYRDQVTGCSNSIQQVVSIFGAPRVHFTSGGGCAGGTITFLSDSTGLSNTPPAIDSITMVIWNYGDGRIDTVRNITNPRVIPTRTYSYAAMGTFTPTLTIVNRDQCAQSYTRRVVVSPRFTPTAALPYTQDFQAGPGEWFQEEIEGDSVVMSDTLWQWGLATGRRIGLAPDRPTNNMWITKQAGPYTPGRSAWVYSPCFDLSQLDKPMIKLDIWRDSRQGVDGVVVEFFDTITNQWKVLGIRDKGINWYNPQYIISSPGAQTIAPVGWSGSSEFWEDARYRLDVSGGDLRGRQNVRFRVAFASSDNTIVNGLEGFAFDNVKVGNRSKGVLVEHFTQQGTPGISTVERNLYAGIYNNLYGRDVHLIQYHTNLIPSISDPVYNAAMAESNSRILDRSITTNGQVRLNGDDFVGTTANLIQNNLERLDMEMLRDDSFAVYLPPLSIRNGVLTVTGAVIATKDIPVGDYSIFTVITEDSILSTQRHQMRAVMRAILPTPDGDVRFQQTWAAGDSIPLNQAWSFNSSVYRASKLEAVVFVQDMNTKKVYQAATTRDLSIFQGPVAVEDLQPAEGKEIVNIKLYPNPAVNYFNVEFEQALEGEYDWQLFDVQGRVLQRGKAEAGTQILQLTTQELSAGVYIFAIHNDQVYTQRKVVISR